jgi:hypothetical protein
MKICSRCGTEQPLINFRQYYNRGANAGTYKFCKECERIETRRKYLVGRGDAATQAQKEELANIYKLYDLRGSRGLDVPGRMRGKPSTVKSIVDTYLQEVGTNEA